MSIYRRKSGRYAVLIDLDPTPTGLRRRRSLGTHATRKDAERAERAALEARDRGIDLSPRTTTVGDMMGRFIGDAGTRCAAKSVERWSDLNRLNIAPSLGAIPLAKLRPAHVNALYAALLRDGRKDGKGGLSARTVHHIHRLLFAAFAWAERMQLVARSVIRSVDPPRPPRTEAKYLTPDEADRLIDVATGTRWHSFLALALATGARRGELAALCWDAVDLDGCTVTIRQSLSQTRAGVQLKHTKTDRIRKIALSSLAVETLRKLRAAQAAKKLAAGPAYVDRGFVFADDLGGAIKPFNYSDAFARLAGKVGLPTSRLHSARHSTATWMIADGIDPRTVSAILGHSDASVTLRLYSHHVSELQAGAVEVIATRLAEARARRVEST